MYTFQRTINKPISFSGVGLHTGKFTKLQLKPAKANTGIIFVRVDTKEKKEIKALIDNVIDTNRGTTLGCGNDKVYTVEHLLAAIFALGIDNVLVELDNIEPPILDGSSKDYFDGIYNVGVKKLNRKRKIVKITEPINYLDPSKEIEMSILPYDGFKISFTVNYDYGNIGEQSYTLDSIDNFKDEIRSARTFCSIGELEFLKSNNLIKGAGLDSGIVFGENIFDSNKINKINNLFDLKLNKTNKNNILNSKSLRYENEPVRHKILDLIGDLSLLGNQISGHVISKKGGHDSNVELVKKIKEKYIKNNNQYKFNKEQIMQVIPHRHPFLLIDEVIDGKPGENIVALKNVTKDDYFLEGHFPGNPIFPGVILIECMAQASCFLSLNVVDDRDEKMMVLSNIKSAKFIKQVKLGDVLRIEVELLKFKLNTAFLRGAIKVDDNVVAKSDFIASVIDKIL